MPGKVLSSRDAARKQASAFMELKFSSTMNTQFEIVKRALEKN